MKLSDMNKEYKDGFAAGAARMAEEIAAMEPAKALVTVSEERDQLRAQLAELAASEVQLREALEAVRHDEIATRTGLSAKTGRLIDAIVAAPPSTAAAELVALRGLEIECADHQCAATGEIQNEGGDCSCGICDALDAVAAARAGTP